VSARCDLRFALLASLSQKFWEPDRRQRGLSEQTAAAIRRQILGIDEDVVEQKVV